MAKKAAPVVAKATKKKEAAAVKAETKKSVKKVWRIINCCRRAQCNQLFATPSARLALQHPVMGY